MGSSAWALFETNKELLKSATITRDKAVLAAVDAMPGKAVEAELGKEQVDGLFFFLPVRPSMIG
jgi:hypothetical protein